MLEIKDLVCGYTSGFTLEDINFTLKEKEFLGIVGPNGSGKTTLIRAITKLLPIRRGQIIIDKADLIFMNFKDIARKIAVVPQGFNTQFDITVEEFVFLGRIPHKGAFQFVEDNKDEQIVKNAMELTEILGLKNRLINSLSGGEIQRAAMARALAQQPQILLLDEPTSHLDIGHQVRILDLLRKLNREKALTIVAIFHDLNLASDYCNKLLLLKNGKIFSVGTPEKVLTYQSIEEVYNTPVIVQKSVASGMPHVSVVPHPEEYRKAEK